MILTGQDTEKVGTHNNQLSFTAVYLKQIPKNKLFTYYFVLSKLKSRVK